MLVRRSQITPHLFVGGFGEDAVGDIADVPGYHALIFAAEHRDARLCLSDANTEWASHPLVWRVFGYAAHVADWLEECSGPYTILCREGLNRSAFVAAAVLLASGDCKTGEDALRLLREKRGPRVLYNQALADIVREWR